MDITQEVITAISTIPVAKKGTEANQFWDMISFLFPLLIIVFFWLIGRRSKQNSQSQQTQSPQLQQTDKQNLSLDDLLTGFKKRDETPTQINDFGITRDPTGDFQQKPNSFEQARPNRTYAGPVITTKPIKPRWWGA